MEKAEHRIGLVAYYVKRQKERKALREEMAGEIKWFQNRLLRDFYLTRSVSKENLGDVVKKEVKEAASLEADFLSSYFWRESFEYPKHTVNLGLNPLSAMKNLLQPRLLGMGSVSDSKS